MNKWVEGRRAVVKRSRFSKKVIPIDDVKALSGSGVYVFMYQTYALYVGCSHNLISRCLDIAHHRRDVLQLSDRVELYPTATVEQALAKEKQFIERLNPRFNGKRNVKVIKTVQDYIDQMK